MAQSKKQRQVTNRGADAAICIDNAGYKASLEINKVYRIVLDDKRPKGDLIRIVDESGEDYLYPSEMFVLVKLGSETLKALGFKGVPHRAIK